MKKVLIIGNTGFVGSWLTELLLIRNYSVFGYSLQPNTKPNLHNLLSHKKRIKSQIYANVLNQKKMLTYIMKIKPKIIVYLASQPLVIESLKYPKDTYNVNIFGLINLFESLKIIKFKELEKLIIFTSDKVYKNLNQKTNFKEDSVLGGDDPYSASKACQDIISESYFESYFNKKVSTIIHRSGNIVGGGDWAKHRIIPDVVRSFFHKKTLVIRNPNHSRPWQHILDVIHAIEIIMLSKLNKNVCQKYNIGTMFVKSHTVGDMIKFYKKYFSLKIIKLKPIKSIEKESLSINSKKIFRELNFKNKIGFKKMNILTASWYKSFYSSEDIIKFTRSQILDYEYFNK
jgi:CDP-glucose 4,6-dehydratase